MRQNSPQSTHLDMNKLKDYTRLFIGWPLSIISIIFIIKIINDQSSGLIFDTSNLNFNFLFFGILLFFLYYLLRSFLWQKILQSQGFNIKFKETTYRYSFSELKRYTPGNIWSFLSRASQFNEVGVDRKTIGISIFADIQLVIIGCGIVSLFAIPWILESPEGLKLKLQALIPLSLALSILFFTAIAFVYKKRYKRKASFAGSIIMPGFNLKNKIELSMISTITYAVFGIASFFVFLGFFNIGFENTLSLSSFFTFSLLVGFLSFLTPTGLGVREVVVALGLTNLLSVGDAGIASISTRIILILSELIFLFIIYLWRKLTLEN